MMREETDEEIVREAIGFADDEGYTELYQDALASLDRLVAERGEMAEKAEARLATLEERIKIAEKERDIETVRADLNENHAFAMQEAVEKLSARLATLEAALREIE